jgi:hypothetical protein
MRASAFFFLALAFNASAAERSGYFVEIGAGVAEHGVGPRTSFGTGYVARSGWGLALTRQRLVEEYMAQGFLAPESMIIELRREVRSTALFLSREWALGPSGNWDARLYAGVHHWVFDGTIRTPEAWPGPDVPDFRARSSDTRPAARVELSRRLAHRLSLGLSLERYRYFGGENVDRIALSLRGALGGDSH